MIYNIVIFDDDKTQCDIIEKMVGEYKPDLMKHIVIISELSCKIKCDKG